MQESLTPPTRDLQLPQQCVKCAKMFTKIFAHNLLTNRNSVFEAIELKQKARKKEYCRKSSTLLLLRLQAMCDMFWLLFWLVFDVVLASAC